MKSQVRIFFRLSIWLLLYRIVLVLSTPILSRNKITEIQTTLESNEPTSSSWNDGKNILTTMDIIEEPKAAKRILIRRKRTGLLCIFRCAALRFSNRLARPYFRAYMHRRIPPVVVQNVTAVVSGPEPSRIVPNLVAAADIINARRDSLRVAVPVPVPVPDASVTILGRQPLGPTIPLLPRDPLDPRFPLLPRDALEMRLPLLARNPLDPRFPLLARDTFDPRLPLVPPALPAPPVPLDPRVPYDPLVPYEPRVPYDPRVPDDPHFPPDLLYTPGAPGPRGPSVPIDAPVRPDGLYPIVSPAPVVPQAYENC